MSACCEEAAHQTYTSTKPAFSGEMMQSMGKMDNAMMTAPMTGDTDHDFAAMMIPHHQGVVDIAKAVLLNGKDLTSGAWLKRSLSRCGKRSK